MKPVLAILIATATILVIMTGSFAMNRMMSAGDHANCFLSFPGEQKCIGLDPIRFATTHISTLLSASLGIIGSFTVLLIALLLLAWFAATNAPKLTPTIFGYSEISTERHTRSIHKQRRWISLLEKRDPSSVLAAST